MLCLLSSPDWRETAMWMGRNLTHIPHEGIKKYQKKMTESKAKLRLKMEKNKVSVDYRSPNCQRLVSVVIPVVNEERCEFVIFGNVAVCGDSESKESP